MRIVTSAEMKHLEAEADASGLTYAEMMRRAGEAVARTVDEELDGTGLVVGLAGPGNNGGDTLVAAAELHEMGLDVRVYLWRREMDGDELVGELVRRDVPIVRAGDDPRHETLLDWLEDADLVMDGLLGTGLTRAIEGDLASILEALAEAAAMAEPPVVVAVDVPSGLNSDTGAVDPHTVPADITVTFGLPKLGQYRFPGAELVGELIHDSIGIADDAPMGDLFVCTPREAAALLPPRPLSAHKGTFGRVLVVAGSVNFTGAAYLSAGGAYRAGCGLVTVALPGSLHTAVASLLPEATFVVLPEDLGVVAKGGAAVVKEQFARTSVLLVGPGLTTERPAAEFLTALLTTEKPKSSGPALGFHPAGEPEAAAATEPPAPMPPLVLDADGLNLLAAHDDLSPADLPAGSVVTPHPGEMARLRGSTAEAINADRVAAARAAAKDWGMVVILKGAFTVIAAPDGRTGINPFANAALAKGGTGDVLAGLVAGFMAQGLEPFEAGVLATFVHGLAAEQAADEVSGRALLAGDLLEMIGPALMGLAPVSAR